MLYRRIRAMNVRRFDREIAGILDTRPLQLKDGPWCIASMVANHDVPMYLTALKSFYPKIGSGKVAAIVDRAMPQNLRDTLSRHLVGIEFVTLEDIRTDPCQAGGTWERLLYCLDRSEREFTIQLDCDTLAVNDDLVEVLACLKANRAFTMSDGFERMSLLDASKLARATPSTYIGITAEAAFDQYRAGENLHYIRGSSGFAGFSKGGYTRAAIGVFHQEMERLIGAKRWREWGSEQCGSNFAIANSPDPLVLPYPEYASFKDGVLRREAKLFHFIGAFRFKEGYFAHRSQEVIAALTSGANITASLPEPTQITQDAERLPLHFARGLTPACFTRYLAWHLAGRTRPVILRMRPRTEFQPRPGPGPVFRLRARSGNNNDDGVAYETFILKQLMPPVWIPPERVELIVDVGANVGMSCLWWLSNYWRSKVLAFEAHPEHVAEARSNISLNRYEERIQLLHAAAGSEPSVAWVADECSPTSIADPTPNSFEIPVVDLFTMLDGKRVDILKIDLDAIEIDLLDDRRFGAIDVRAIVVQWRTPDSAGRGGEEWCKRRLRALGFRIYVSLQEGEFGIVWGYKAPLSLRLDTVLPATSLHNLAAACEA